MMRSSIEFPISNGQTIEYYYTFYDRATGLPIALNGKPITYQLKFRQILMDAGTASIFNDAGGKVTSNILFYLPDIMLYVADKQDNEKLYVEVNLQFYADGLILPGRPVIEYVSPNLDDLAEASKRVIVY